MSEAARAHAAALMRVNHAGEVCAQALYQGQAITARDPATQDALRAAAQEEQDHLVWCAERIGELGGRTSALNPAWYGASLAMGVAAGAMGDRWNLAFLAETEHQVEAHLAGHLEQLSVADERTRSIIEQMRLEEGRHRATAQALGAAELPQPVRKAMQIVARAMTKIAYRI